MIFAKFEDIRTEKKVTSKDPFRVYARDLKIDVVIKYTSSTLHK